MKVKVVVLLIGVAFLVLLTDFSTVQSAYYTASFVRSSYQLPGGIVISSSPTLADVDDDVDDEVIVGTSACRGNAQGTCTYNQATVLVVMDGDGRIKWHRDVGGPIESAPAVADINNDTYPEIVVSFGGNVDDMDQNGGVMAFDRLGNELWRFYTYDHFPADGYADGVVSSPTLCDVDGDNDMEIAFGGWDQRIYLLDHAGNSLWNNLPYGGTYSGRGYMNADSVWSTASCADLNGDGAMEIIIGADITGGGVLPDSTQPEDGGFLYIFDKDGNVLVRRQLPESVYAAPAVGNLDGQGTLEIVSGTSWYWWNAHGRTETPYVYVFDTRFVFDTSKHYSDPTKLPDFPNWPQATAYPGFSSPALADFDGDDDLEVVIGAGHPDSSAGDGRPGAGLVYAWHHDGMPVDGWPVAPKNAQGYDSWLSSSPTIADIDADGQVEVLVSMLWDVHVYNTDGSAQDLLQTYWSVWGSPAVGDADGDGYLEVWIGGSNVWEDPAYGYLWRFESDTQGIGALPWPMFHRDAQNVGVLIDSSPRLQVDPARVTIPFTAGQAPMSQQFTVTNDGGMGSTLDWHADVDWRGSDAANWFVLDPASGSLAASASDTVAMSVNAAQVGDPGTYRGIVTVTGAGTSMDVTVVYSVPASELQLSSAQAIFLMEPTGRDTESTRIAVRNGGGGTVQWTASPDQAWLDVSPQNGTTESDPYLTLTVDKSTLSEGSYAAHVTIQPADSGVSAKIVEVKLYIGTLYKVFAPFISSQ